MDQNWVFEKIGLEEKDRFVYAESDFRNRQYYRNIFSYSDTDEEQNDEDNKNIKCKECEYDEFGYVDFRCDKEECQKLACTQEYAKIQPIGQKKNKINYWGHPLYCGEISKYEYKIIALKIISNNQFVYVVERTNKDFTDDAVDTCFYLKFYDNGFITVNWLIRSYNPYFGCRVKTLDYSPETQTVTMTYHEKHGLCMAVITPDMSSKENKDYLHPGKKIGKVDMFKKMK
jgi:hypothetical protein